MRVDWTWMCVILLVHLALACSRAAPSDDPAAAELSGEASDAQLTELRPWPCAGGVCDDGDLCTDDHCNTVTGACEIRPNAAMCPFQSFCANHGRCMDGTCVRDPDECDDHNACTTDTCAPVGGCVHQAVSGLCSDGDACTSSDICVVGACVGSKVDCSDGVDCTTDSCDPATGACAHPAMNAACDDGIACTTDSCLPGTGCQNLVACNDGNDCTSDTCSSSVGCTHSNTAAGTPCSDGDGCTSGDLCSGGVCKGTAAVCGNGLCQCGETAASCKADCTGGCGDGVCDGKETVPKCPSDCGLFAKKLGGPCVVPGTRDVCGNQAICAARSVQGGGNVCVAEFDTWLPVPDAHPAADFSEYAGYVWDHRTGLMWAKPLKGAYTWQAALTACTTESFGGFYDWRTPTVSEALSLIDNSSQPMATFAPNLVWLGDLGGVIGQWTTVPSWATGTQPAPSAWAIDFTHGRPYAMDKALPAFVRCVR